MNKKTLLLTILLLVTLPTALAQTINLDTTFTEDTTILLDLQNVTSFTLTGNHTGDNSSATLLTNQGEKRVVGVEGNIDFEDVCAQTCELEPTNAAQLRLEIHGELHLQTITYETTQQEEPPTQITTQEISTQSSHASWYNSNWTQREKITISSSQIDEELTDFPVYVDLADLSSTFHSNVRSDGGDIRITQSDGTSELPREIVNYNAASDTGELHFKANSISNATDTEFYVYYGNSGAADYAPVSTYGAQNVWDNYNAVYHMGEDNATHTFDSTKNLRHGRFSGTMPDTRPGPMGDMQAFSGGSSDTIILEGAGDLIENSNGSFIYQWQTVVPPNNNKYFFTVDEGPDNLGPTIYIVNGVDYTRFFFNLSFSRATMDVSNATWEHHANTWNTDTVYAYENGTLQDTGAHQDGSQRDDAYLGSFKDTGNYMEMNITEFRIANFTASPNYLQATYNNQQNTTTFYAVASAEEAPPVFGEEQAGNWGDTRWEYREKITINASQVNEELTDFPVYIDLADLSSTFHTNVQNNGGDIRTTQSDGTSELPREVVTYNATTDTGELYFKANTLSNTTNTEFYIYYGNNQATDYSPTTTYGAQNVWSDDYVYVSHDGGATDSTKQQNDGTGNGGVTLAGATGQFGKATAFDGTDDYISLGTVNWDLSNGTAQPLTMQAWYNWDGSNDTVQGIFQSIDKSNYPGNNPPYGIYLESSGAFKALIQESDNSGNSVGVQATPTNQWTSVAATYNSTNLSVYQDGLHNDTIAVTDIYDVNETPEIGVWKRSRNRYFTGSIDEIRILKTALSQQWIKAEYSNQEDTKLFYTVSSPDSPRIQFASAEGINATATWNTQPTAKNLLVAISYHRYDSANPIMLSPGWTPVFENHHQDWTPEGSRRGLAMWYKIAGENEPLNITTTWSNPALESENRHNTLVVQEFNGTYTLDANAINSSLNESVSSQNTGETPTTTSTNGLVVSALGSYNTIEEANWTNNLNNNIRLVDTEDAGGAQSLTVQSAYTASEALTTWQSTATWTSTEQVLAGIAAYKQTTLASIETPILNSSQATNLTTENLTVHVNNITNASAALNFDWRQEETSIAVLNMPFNINTSSTLTRAIRDYSTYDNSATLGSGTSSQAPAWKNTCVVGGCYDFDGVDDIIEVPDAPELTPSQYTMSAWFNVKGTTSDGSQGIIGKGTPEDHIGMDFNQPENAFRCVVEEPDGVFYLATDNVTLQQNSWHHGACVFDPNTNELQAYLNGTLIDTVDITGLTFDDTTDPLQIGNGVENDGNHFNGSIDEVQMYNRALSQEQIQQLYQQGANTLAGNQTNTSTLASQETQPGEVWTAAVTPSDGRDDGTTRTSNQLTVTISELNITKPHFTITTKPSLITNNNSVLYYDLSLAPETFWTLVDETGSNVQVLTSGNKEVVNHEISGFSREQKQGSLFFNAKNLSPEQATTYAVKYGQGVSNANSSALWNDYAGVWHVEENTSKQDSTKNNNTAHNNYYLDYETTIGTSTDNGPAGRPHQSGGAYIIHDKIWAFYGNGTDTIYKTKQVAEGGTWSSAQTVVSGIGAGESSTIAFDGEHLHLAHYNNTDTDIVYQRLTPRPNGTLQFGEKVLAWSDIEYDAGSSNRFTIHTDKNRHIWLQFHAENGTHEKPVIASSTNTSGGWTSRPGYPKNLDTIKTTNNYGTAPSIVELSDGKIIHIWANGTNPNMQARSWTPGINPEDEGTLGAIEDTGVYDADGAPWERSNAIALDDNRVILQWQDSVARRSTDGTWTALSSPNVDDNGRNIITRNGASIRLWDDDAGDIRYYESTDGGDTWSSATTKYAGEWMRPIISSDANYHGLMWRDGTSPYDVKLGLEGTPKNINQATTEGKIGLAAVFDGTQDHLRASNSESLNITGDTYTLSGWVYPQDISGDTDFGVISKAHEPESNIERYHLGVERTGAINARAHNQTSQNNFETASTPMINNSWQHLTAVYNSTNLLIYRNGALIDSTPVTGNLEASERDLIFGKRYNDRFMTGYLDELRVSGQAQSTGWIQTNYNNQNDNQAFWSTTNFIEEMPIATTFNGDTTNFTAESNLYSVNNVVLEKTTYGRINWKNTLTVLAQNYDKNVLMGDNWVFVNSTVVHASHNSSANITIYGNFNTPQILKDGIECETCTILNTNETQTTFNVTGFSNYSIQQSNSPPTHNIPILNSTLGTNTTTENLTVYTQNLSSTQGDEIRLTTEWFVNNNSLTPILVPMSEGNTTSTKDYARNSTFTAINNTYFNATGGPDSLGRYVFDGNNDALEDTTAGAALNGLDEFTISVWVKSEVTNTDNGILLGRNPDGTDSVFGLRYDEAGSVHGGTNALKAGFSSTGGSFNIETSNNTQSTGWQHIAITWKSGEELEAFFNATRDTPEGVSAPVTGTITGADRLLIGRGAKYSSGQGWQGSISQLQIFNRKLTDEQITLLYEEGKNNTQNKSISSTETQVGEVWSAAVTPSDGTQAGITKTSNSLEILPPTPISSCQEIAESGLYALTTNLSSTATCLTITANDVDITGDGHTITYATSSDYSSAVHVQANNFALRNTTITEGASTRSNSQAILLNNSEQATINQNTLTTQDGVAIKFLNAPNNQIINNTLQSSSGAKHLDLQTGSTNNDIYYNTIQGSGDWIDDQANNNSYNTTVAGAAQGNTYPGILDFDVFDSSGDGYADVGRDHPINASKTSRWSGFGADYGPATTREPEPILDDTRITPRPEALNNQQLQGLCEAYHPTQSTVTMYYRWYQNGAEHSSGNQTINTEALTNINNISQATTNRDDEWIISCLASDTTTNSSWQNSSATTITNVPPTHDDPVLNTTPTTNLTTQDLTVHTQNLQDYENDDISLAYDWRENGTSIAVLNLPFNANVSASTTGAVSDYSTYNNDATLGGGTSSDAPTWTPNGVRGGTYNFTYGTSVCPDDCYVEVNDDESLNLQTSSTISAWVYFEGSTSDDHRISGHGDGTNPSWNWGITDDGTQPGGMSFELQTGSNDRYYSNSDPALNTWQHVALTREGSTITFYLNGQEDGTATISTSAEINPTGNLRIGDQWVDANDGTETEGWNGLIDEFNIYPRTLSQEQIEQQYNEGTALLAGNKTNSSTLVSQETNIGEVWSATVTARDQKDDATTKTSNELTILELTGPINITFTAPTPANNTLVNKSPATINTSINTVSLEETLYHFDGLNHTLYDSSTILLLNFNNRSALGENNTLAKDTTNNQNDGQIYGGATYKEGKHGLSIRLDGSDDYVNVGTVGISGNDSRTIAAWVKTADTSQGSYTNIFGFAGGSTNYEFFDFEVDGGGACAGNGYFLHLYSGDHCLLPNWDDSWHHLVGTYDGERIIGYLDGTLVVNVSDPGINTIDNVQLGTRADNSNYFNGSVDDARIYDRALSPQEVEQLYISSLEKHTDNEWTLRIDQPLTEAGNFTYYVKANNSATSNQTEVRTLEYELPPIQTNSSFITTWKTDNPGTSNNNTITFPLEGSGTYDFDVQWGDGTQTSVTSPAQATHTYEQPGIYNVTVTGTINGWRLDNGGDGPKLLEVRQWGSFRFGNNGDYFEGASNLQVSANDTPNLAGTTNMNDAFRGTNLAIANGFEDWDVSNVTIFADMFEDTCCFNANISGWNTSSMTSIGGMFDNADSFNQDLDQWDVSKVSGFSSLFFGANLFNGNISTWNTSGVTSMSRAFWGTNFSGDVSNWDVSNVNDFSYMFRFAGDEFNSNISGWNTSKATDMEHMLRGAGEFDQDISNWDTSKVTDMSYMLSGTSSLDFNIGAWDVSQVTDMSDMLDNSGLSVANYDKMFQSWSAQALQSDIILDASGLRYSVAGADERQQIINDYNWIINDAGLINTPLYETFDGTTTEYSAEGDLTNVSNAILEKTEYGKIAWNQPIDASSQDFDSHVTMDDDWVSVDISNLRASLNNSANITIYNNYAYTDIRLDGVLCDETTTPSCTVISSDQDQITFSVQEMGNYSIEESQQEIFISTWKTNNPGSSNNNQVSLPLESDGDYSFTVDWGDASQDTINVWDDPAKTHTYSSAGTYNISIQGTLDGWRFNNDGDAQKLLDITRWGGLRLGNNSGYFHGANNLQITALDVLNLTGTTNLNDAFRNTNLSSANSLRNINTNQVTMMNNAFANTSFNEDISAWNINKVTSLQGFLNNSQLSVANYDKLLQEWSKPTPQSNVEFHAGTSQYSVAGIDGRVELTSTYNWSITDAGLITVPLYETFNGTTTNYSAEGDLTNVSNAILEKTAYGKIAWNQPIDASSQDFDSHVQISEGVIDVDISNLRASLNNSANLTIYGEYLSPVILFNGAVCDQTTTPSCENIQVNDTEITFTAAQMGRYEVSTGVGITFIQPTPTDGTITELETFTMNTTLNTTELDTLIINWDSTNEVVYDQDNLLLYNFDNNSAVGDNTTRATDSSRYERHATIQGASWTSSGAYNNALSFTSSDELTLEKALVLNGDFSISYWFNTGRSSSWRLLNNDADYDYSLWHPDSDEIEIAGSTNILLSESFQTGEWEHLILTKQGSDVRIYRSGREVGQGSWNGELRINQIGGTPDNSGWSGYEGSADEIHIYNKTLSAQEAQQLYNSNLRQLTANQWTYQRHQRMSAEAIYPYYAYTNDTNGQEAQTETRTIQLTAVPELGTTKIQPARVALNNQPLRGVCGSTRLEDANITYNYRWYKDGTLHTTGSNGTYPAGKEQFVNTLTNTSIGEEWMFSCQATDGVTTTNYTNSTPTTIQAATTISTCSELQAINNNRSANYQLTNDIDCSETASWNSGEGFQPIGDTTTPYQGVFDAQGHRITSLTINRPSSDDQALFVLGSNSIARNLIVDSAHITGGRAAAIISATNNGEILNCLTRGVVSAGGEAAGGVAGYNNGNITRCANYADVYQRATLGSTHDVGGIAGQNTGEIRECSNQGLVTYRSGDRGGIAGDNSGVIDKCYNTGEVRYSSVSGITNSNPGTIKNSFWDTQTSKQASSSGGSGEATTQMKELDTYTNTSPASLSYPWSFSDYQDPATLTASVWELDSFNDGYPYLNTLNYTSTTPDNPSYERVLSTQATLKWDEVASANNYTLQRAADSSGAPGTYTNITTTTNTRHTDTGLSENTTYWYRVYATTNAGEQTPSSPTKLRSAITISTCNELQAIQDDQEANYELTTDIDCSDTYSWNSGEGFQPIGTSLTNPFLGHLEGEGNSITSLYINRPTSDNQGLFGYIGHEAVINNISFESLNIHGDLFTGGVAGRNYGTIQNCLVTGNILAYRRGGGIAGINYGYINSCGSYATTEATDIEIGGIAGINHREITNCFVIQSTYSYDGIRVGGITGQSNDGSHITNCYTASKVVGRADDGGIRGDNNGGTITSSFVDTEAGTDSTGGGTSKTTSQMQDVATYTNNNTLGLSEPWDFVANPNDDTQNQDIWNINSTENQGYPYLTQIQLHLRTPSKPSYKNIHANRTTITWEEIPQANNYTLQRAADSSGTPGAFSTVTTTTQTSYTDTGLTENTTYWYRVRATTNSPHPYSTPSNVKTAQTITTCTQLQAISTSREATYELADDIDCSDTINWNGGEGFSPKGSSYGSSFKGSLQGSSHTIGSLYIDRPNNENQALLYIGPKGVVNNLTVQQATIYADPDSAIIASHNYGTLSACITSGTVTGSGGTVAGVASINEEVGNISGCANYAAISANGRHAGGISARNYGSIGDCANYGDVTNTGSGSVAETGGAVGSNYNYMNNCLSTGRVEVDNIRDGGLVGHGSGSVTNSFWDTQTSGYTGSSGGTGKTTSQMQDVATYTDTATSGLGEPWDFENNPNEDTKNQSIWKINATENDGYPYLATINLTQTIPQPPTFTDIYSDRLTINWQAVQEADNYTLQRADDNNGVPENFTTLTTINNLAYLDDGVSASNEYWYRVRANIEGEPQIYSVARKVQAAIPITTCTQLQNINDDRTTNYQLHDHIDCSETETWNAGEGFEPLGENEENAFTGSLQGTGHAITNLHINRPSQGMQALLYVGETGYVNNISVQKASISGGLYTAIISARNYGTIQNCQATGSVNANGQYAGAISARNHGNITGCAAYVEVTTTSSHAGGITGRNEGTINECHARNSVHADVEYSGGIAGRNQGSINECVSSAQVSGSTNTGGAVGLNEANVTNTFWDTQASGQATSSGATGKTTSELQTSTTYTDTATTGLDEAWNLSEQNSYAQERWYLLPSDYPRLEFEFYIQQATTQPSSVTVSGETLEGYCQATGVAQTATYNYTWLRNGVTNSSGSLTAATNELINVDNTTTTGSQASDEWTLQCQANTTRTTAPITSQVIQVVEPRLGIEFINPTPASGVDTIFNQTTINASIDTYRLENVSYEWAQRNYSLYDDSLVLMYNFDNQAALEEDEETIKDQSNQEIDATNNGGSYTTGIYESALSLDGTSYADTGVGRIGDTGLFADANENFTVSFWAKIQPGNTGTLVARAGGTGSSRTLQFTAWSTDERPGIYIRGALNTYELDADDGEWNHHALTWNGTNASFYYNGAFIDHPTVGTASEETNQNITIGARTTGDFLLQGDIDELRIWERALDEEEIQQTYRTNLRRTNETQWYLTSNQKFNGFGTYDYHVQASNTLGGGVTNQTETRNITFRDRNTQAGTPSTWKWGPLGGNNTRVGSATNWTWKNVGEGEEAIEGNPTSWTWT